jgi:hypothetical protein
MFCRLFLVILLPFVFLCPVTTIFAKDDDFEPLSDKWLSTLDNVTFKINANMEGIRTWQGKVLYKRKQPAGKWADDMEITFYVDRVHSKRLVVTRHIKTEIDGQIQPLDILGIFLDKDLYYEYRTRNPDGIIPIPGGKTIQLNEVKKGNVPEFQQSFLYGHLRVDPSSLFRFSYDNLKDNFNPFVVLLFGEEQYAGTSSVCHSLTKLIRQKTPLDGCEIRLKNENSRVSISYKRQQADEPDIYVYDMKFGGNTTYSRIPCFGSAQVRNVEYKEINGYFVPQKVDYKLREEIHETIEFLSQSINEQIAEEIFTPKTLGVKQGDRLFDGRTQTSSSITSTDFPKYEQIVNSPRKSFGYVSLTFIVLGIVFIFIAIFMKWRQWNKPNN